MGIPPVKVKLIADTGSDLTNLYCNSYKGQLSRSFYDPEVSTTSHNLLCVVVTLLRKVDLLFVNITANRGINIAYLGLSMQMGVRLVENLSLICSIFSLSLNKIYQPSFPVLLMINKESSTMLKAFLD